MWLETFWEALRQAIHLIVSGDPELVDITSRSLQVSFYAILMASTIGVPLGVLIGIKRFWGRGFVKTVFTTLLGMPTVALGLILYLILSRSGPLGSLELLYTMQGMSIGQALLVIPIIVSFTISATESKDVRLKDLAHTLGASELETSMVILREASNAIVLALVSAFNRAFAELGVAMMVGANIWHVTRLLTTSIALQTAMGETSLSIALSIILMTIVFTLNGVVSIFKREM